MMKSRFWGIFLIAAFFVVSDPGMADEQMIDVVRLKDGTVLRGLIVEQNAGVSLKLATADRLVYTLSNQEVSRVEKQRSGEPLPFYYGDVVLLKDGVMFKGTIVEQRPEESLTLRTDNDILLTFRTGEIWKIMKEKRLAGRIEEEADVRSERERLKIALQIELVRDRIRTQEGRSSSGSGAEGDLAEEIDRLKEQMQALEDEEQQIEYEQITDRRDAEREKLQELQGEIEALLEELLHMLEECEGGAKDQTAAGGESLPQTDYSIPGLRVLRLYELPAITDDFSTAGEERRFSFLQIADKQSAEQLSEQMSEALREIIESTIYKIPTQEQIDALALQQSAYAFLTSILSTSRWKVPSTRNQVRSWAELVPLEERVFLYEAYDREGAGLYTCLNLIPVLNIGSFMQGNIWGAVISIVPGVLGGALYVSTIDPAFEGDPVTNYLISGGLAAGSYAFSLLSPYWYQQRWNRKLQNRLLLDEQTIREVEREIRKSALLNPPGLRLLPVEEGLAVQLDLVSLCY